MTLIKDRAVAEDEWRRLADDEELPADAPVIVSLDRWRDDAKALRGRNAPLGVLLRPGQPPELIADDLDRFDVIALEFPNVSDGRAFSYARLLRDRYGFKGEIRAVGTVLRDHLNFMERCGFDSFELSEGKDVAGAMKAFDEFSVVYQAATRGPDPAFRKRAKIS
jgi:uncharacterized protein (DUF934 family)